MSNDRPEGKWDPGQYLRYGGHRLRPAIELFQRIDLDEPSICYDIGCGAGEIAIAMTQRWPSAKVNTTLCPSPPYRHTLHDDRLERVVDGGCRDSGAEAALISTQVSIRVFS